MNSTDEILTFNETLNNYYSPTLTRRLQGYTYDLPEKLPKKEKKWSIGSLFRRKKKDDSDSSDDEKSLSKKKKRSDSRKKKKTVGTFDHVVMPRNLYSNGYHEESGILSDPTISHSHLILQPTKNESMDDINNSKISSNDSLTKNSKNRKGFKVRAEARRTTLRDSSSDEDSQMSASSQKIRNDEVNSSFNRKSRAARTERYLKRHSRDGENPKNYLRLSKSDAESVYNNWKMSSDSNRSPSRSPLPPTAKIKSSYSSLSSQSPSITGLSTIPPSHGNYNKLRVSNSTSNPNYKPPLSMNDYNNIIRNSNNRLNSSNTNINQRSLSYDDNINNETPEIIHVQFPVLPKNRRNLSLIDPVQVSQSKQPPPPPPRDPRRMMANQYYENRPTTYYFDQQRPITTKLSYPYSQLSNSKSKFTSDDHIPKPSINLVPRPNSATPVQNNNENFNYLADKNPRSRKPIFIKSNNKSETQKALDFWKQKDKDSLERRQTRKSVSPQMFTCQTSVQTQVFLPSVLNKPEERANSPFKPITDDKKESNETKRESTNLEDALDELEAIYNSLKLGDEDLLERAEQREKDVTAKKLMEKGDYYPSYTSSRGTLSDSSFSYEPFDSVDSPRRKRYLKKSQTIDRKGDDMAFRKLNRERSTTINDPQSVISKVSYLLSSPAYKDVPDDETKRPNKEPDVTLDDMVYRNIKYSNNTLKVLEPQPPFGIPLGPITPASNSDYLHAVPEDTPRPIYKPRKIPDLVKDDLAYRNLRKDSHKEEPALPPVSPDDLRNNNHIDLNSLKKKRAVRSLSANIGSLVNKNNNDDVENEFKTLTDIADAMEIARQVLREKENKINATKKGFMSDTENNKSSLTEKRLNFLNSLKTPMVNDEKPPKSPASERRSPKESTPIPVSPLEDKRIEDEIKTTSFDDLLTALALETRETSERITNELNKLDETENNEKDGDISINKKLSDIDSVSEQAKLCEKMLEGVVDSSDLMVQTKTPELNEVVEQMDEPLVKSVANIVLTRPTNDKNIKEIVSESEHDYENLLSDNELNINDGEVKMSASPFEEHKAELIATFQELKNADFDLRTDDSKNKEPIYDNIEEMKINNNNNNEEGVTGKHSTRRSRSRLPRWLRPHSCGNLSDPTTMSESRFNNNNNNLMTMEARAERMARYKEERRRQLASQYQNDQLQSPMTTPIRNQKSNDKSLSSSSDSGPRTTRASRLRAAAAAATTNAQDNTSSLAQATKLDSPLQRPHLSPQDKNSRLERDKSSKRKSNLNRSLNSEEVPNSELSDIRNRRRRRRFFTPDISEQSIIKDSNESKSDTNFTASTTLSHSSTTSPINTISSSRTIATTTPSPTTPKKSDLRIHMENARKGITPSYSEMGKYKTNIRRAVTSSPKERQRIYNLDDTPPDLKSSSNNKENFLKNKSKTTCSDSDVKTNSKIIAKRMEELTTLTRETLAKVEKLKCNKESIRKTSPTKQLLTQKIIKIRQQQQPSSILKNKKFDEHEAGPVSILKRKVSQEDHQGASSSSNHTPPVTFSPNVIEPTTTNRKCGILKKRRSLDESQVMRHRSCSPDVLNKLDSRSILKNQRRSSLEELTRTQSPEQQLHGILKRKISIKNNNNNDDLDESLNSPQSILKRRSGGSSAGSTGNSPHVSITTAVILAAAGGAEMVLDNDNNTIINNSTNTTEPVKPILKKKSFSDEYPLDNFTEIPKPILKKKSSTETEDFDDRPKPILKVTRSNIDKDTSASDTDSDVRPILKQDLSIKPRLSFCGDSTNKDDVVLRRNSRRSNTICTEFNISNVKFDKEEDRELKKPRPLSVSELVMNFENTLFNTGAIPKRTNLNRNSDRYRTQPVTSNEFEESLNLVRSPQVDEKISPESVVNQSIGSLLNFTSSLEDDRSLNSFLTTSLQNNSPDNSGCVKMSSDSAFQSLGDGLELEQEENEITTPIRPKLEPSKLELQMKAIAEEAKKIKLGKGSSGLQKYRNRRTIGDPSERSNPNRFATQPVTFDEVQSACKLNKNIDNDSGDQEENEPSRLSISERIKLFNNVKLMDVENVQKRDISRRRYTRFQTQPVTSNEVKSARCIPPICALEEQDSEKFSCERRGILKSSSPRYLQSNDSQLPPPRPVLKKKDSFDSSPSRRSILKSEQPDSTYDEGISCNDSGSDSEVLTSPKSELLRKKSSKSSSSDGESSGGREIRSIFKNATKLKVKHALESLLLKSKSQSTVWDEESSNNSLISKRITNIRRSQTQTTMPRSIAELQAKLQKQGESEWKKRIQQNNNANDELKFLKDKNRYNDEKSILALKKDELDAASKQWKSRVEKSDAEKFSVAGRMVDKNKELNLSINIDENNKKKPEPKRFKGRESDSSSTPVSPDKNKYIDLSRSLSVPDPNGFLSPGLDNSSQNSPAKKVSLIKLDDYTFKNFYKSVEETKNEEKVDLSLDDFDVVKRHSLLVQKKNVQVRRRRGASKNPIKALAQRSDIVSDEYTEVLTGVAEREKKRLNIERLAKNSNLAVEALAGLASKEDFKSVALKKSTLPTTLVPFKEVMLLQVKGRRHVQTRLVEPIPESINEGDNYILITSNCLYNFIGKYSNVIEQSRAADIVNHIQQSGDLGCKVENVITINSTTAQSNSENIMKFWKILGVNEPQKLTDGGHPNEDEIYESNILSTNMIYGLEDNELVPLDEYWGSIPKIDMLEPTKVFVFDFGSEMYVWSGKNAPLDKKRRALKLAKELWDEGYNYMDCSVCPLNIASILGDRSERKVSHKEKKRPDWALFAKLTQHRETILFKEKFLDWPDFSRVIRVRGDDNNDKFVDPSFDVQPCNVNDMTKNEYTEPDLEVEGYHLGRGDQYFDDETKRLFEFKTLDLKCWRILENTCEELFNESIGQFYNGDSYILRWCFRMTVKGRELSGKPSRHLQTGRDRCIYYCWQGSNASINEKGYAALLTIELDSEKAPQIRVVQGLEPAAFLKLFNGKMVVHLGKREDKKFGMRLFVVRGEIQSELHLIEVPCNKSQLRSRTSFIIINVDEEKLLLWHGCKANDQTRKVAKLAAENIIKNKPNEFQLNENNYEIEEMLEGDDNKLFNNIFKEGDGDDNENTYFSLTKMDLNYDYQMRLFHLSSISGVFEATEVLCPHRSEYSSPYPFLQSELYSASQPAIFLIDNHHELWLWQGWWPDTEEKIDLSDQTGSGAVRWQAERRAAMQTAINYWQKTHSGDESIPAYLVWAGLEPLEFKNLFPTWIDRDDVAEINLKEGKKPNAKLLVEKELALMSRTSYPLSELLQRPLPEGVDPTHLEIYLSPEDFQEFLSMTKEEFQKLPLWKQTAIKKEKGLF